MQTHLQGFRLYLLLTAIALVAFLVSLDGFIVNVAIPTISGELGVPEDVGTWIITVFSAASTCCVPLAGCLSVRYGNFPLFILGIFLFGLFSLFSGLSHTFSFLLISRALQGCSAGLISPISLALIVNNFPGEKRGPAVGFWSFFSIVGPAMGPMIGGWLSDYHWHWLFFLNIPIVLFSAITVWFLLRHTKEDAKPAPIDIVGMVLLFIWIGTLQSALNRWNIDDWFRSPFIVTLFILSALCLIFLLVWEHYHADPFISLSLFFNRSFSLPTLTTALGIALLFSSFILDSLWVQDVLGYTPAWAGLSLSPVGFFPLIFYPLVGRFVTRLDMRIWVIASCILYACTFLWLSHITVYTPFSSLAFARLVQGIGFAFFTVPNAFLIIRGIRPEKVASVVSLYSFTRLFFVGLGVALGITLWIFRTAFYQTTLTARFFPSNPLIEELYDPFKTVTQSEPQSIALIYETVQAEASTLALADIYYLYCWLFIALCFVVLFYKIPKT